MSALDDPPLPATPAPKLPLVVNGLPGAGVPYPPVITSVSAPVAVLVTVMLWPATVWLTWTTPKSTLGVTDATAV